ncbi:MAG: c-type cytochrome [Deferribacteres bacterium]|nr:c-type cytochrome [candidate division KSB1 bacterium]MCB9502295.1 c-type cytochrome [Deferribacteres bacterium]
MKKLFLVLGSLVLLLVLVVIAGLVYLQVGFPKVSPAPNMTIEQTPERLARGEYLTKHVTMCLDCHSDKNQAYFSQPLVPGTEGKGGNPFPGVPGTLYVPNITPAALSNWTDGEILRAITAGVDKDGRPLAPMMPYTMYSHLTREDAEAIVAYIRTLPAIQNEKPIPEPSMNFPLNLIFRTIPKDADPWKKPNPEDKVAVGNYLTQVGGCEHCHTPFENGQLVENMKFAGGQEFSSPEWGTVRSANITPEEETGIGGWDEEDFIGMFKTFADSSGRHITYNKGEMQTEMPWTHYAGMTNDDLSAIYAYLRTVKPISHEVKKFTPPSVLTK